MEPTSAQGGWSSTTIASGHRHLILTGERTRLELCVGRCPVGILWNPQSRLVMLVIREVIG